MIVFSDLCETHCNVSKFIILTIQTAFQEHTDICLPCVLTFFNGRKHIFVIIVVYDLFFILKSKA